MTCVKEINRSRVYDPHEPWRDQIWIFHSSSVRMPGFRGASGRTSGPSECPRPPHETTPCPLHGTVRLVSTPTKTTEHLAPRVRSTRASLANRGGLSHAHARPDLPPRCHPAAPLIPRHAPLGASHPHRPPITSITCLQYQTKRNTRCNIRTSLLQHQNKATATIE